MPRSSHTGELEFDPEIEKTACRLRKETKQLKGEASTSSTSKADFELNVPTSSESEEKVMAQNPERTINEMTSPNLNQQPLCIEYPTLDVDFELKSGLIHLLSTFRGLAGEDPHKHLEEFHVVCSGMRPQGVTEENVKLRAYPFSLGDKVKDWLYSLPSGTIVSWNELKKQFLENYFPASRTTNIRKDISGIRQFLGESFYEYWGRFKQLVESCPHHQLPDHLLIQYFYEGLSEANRSLVDAASGGALYDNTPPEARKLITTMEANNQQFGSRSENPPQKVHEVSTYVDERLDKLTFLVEKILVGGTQQVKACGICTSLGHFIDVCPTFHEKPTEHADAVGYSSKHSKFEVSSEPTSLLRWPFGIPSTRHGHAQQGKIEKELEIPPKQAEEPNQVSNDISKVLVTKPPFPERYEEDNSPNSTSILLGRPFPKTARTKIDVHNGTLTMEFDGEVIRFNIYESMRYPSDVPTALLLDSIDPFVQEFSTYNSKDQTKLVLERNLTSTQVNALKEYMALDLSIGENALEEEKLIRILRVS
ncbi:UNVERIFIED_CONTAM: hypothetical protein Sangu_2169500 [Sesamum angustifolium]|uniref:Retrotransposon gag domain-containing protein n=1 Tax=Sesamum angustifolium TaxID=2727405 RepID=A0AAW2LDS9_9LAMI